MKEAFPTATIVRPADIYGHEDRFLSFYASMRAFPFHLVPVLDRGNSSHKLPVYVCHQLLPTFSKAVSLWIVCVYALVLCIHVIHLKCATCLQVGDVAQGVVNIISDSTTVSQTFEFVG